MDPESSKLTTFITPFGRYRFNRLPFRITSAPEHFQRQMSEILAHTEGAVCLIDDILVYRKSQSEHDQRLLTVLKKLNEAGLTLQQRKVCFQYNQYQIPWTLSQQHRGKSRSREDPSYTGIDTSHKCE